jgi:hypothetical protein
MLLSAMSLLVVAQLSSEIPEGLMNNSVCIYIYICIYAGVTYSFNSIAEFILVFCKNVFSQSADILAQLLVCGGSVNFLDHTDGLSHFVKGWEPLVYIEG